MPFSVRRLWLVFMCKEFSNLADLSPRKLGQEDPPLDKRASVHGNVSVSRGRKKLVCANMSRRWLLKLGRARILFTEEDRPASTNLALKRKGATVLGRRAFSNLWLLSSPQQPLRREHSAAV